METLIDRTKRLRNQEATSNDAIDPREQAIIDSHTSKVSSDDFLLQRTAKARANSEIEGRRQSRAYAEAAPSEIADPVREMLTNLDDRRRVLGIMRKMTPEQRDEALRLAPGIAQQIGDERGGGLTRFGDALSKGTARVSQPLMELAGIGGTNEEIDYIRKLEAASQEFSAARPDDPWYERGPLQATEMVPWMTTIVGAGGLGRAAATGAAGRFAAGRAAAQGLTARQAVIAAGESAIPGQLGTSAILTAGRAGELAGMVTAHTLAGGYAQEVDQLKQIGMEDGAKMRLLAAGTSAVVGLIEGIVPNPIKAGPVPLTQGAAVAARQYLWEAAKRAPAEMSEEYLQGVTSGLGQHIAQYLDENAQDKTVGDAFALGWEQTKEAALPMAFLLGVPAVGGAGMSAARAQRLTRLQEMRAKGFISEEEAKQEGIEGKNRKERLANADKEIEDLQNPIEPPTPTADPASPQGPPPLPGAPGGATQVTPPPLPQPGSPPTLPGTPQSPTPGIPSPPAGATVPGGEAGAAVAGAGKGIVDGLYQSMYERLQAGKYSGIYKSPTDDAVSAEHARQPFQTPEEIRQFVNDGSRPIQETSPTEVTQEEAARLMQERIAQRRAGQSQSTPAATGTEQEPNGNNTVKPSGDVVLGTGQGPLDIKGKLYREDPNAKTPSERLKSRQVIDPSEGVSLVTKDQFGKPIPEDTQKARQEFVDKAKPGAEFGIKGFETSGPYRVMDDGQLLDTKTGRVMGDVQSRANQVKPGDITWSNPTQKQQTGENESVPAGDAQSKGTTETTPTATVDREWQPTELPKPKYPDEVDALPKDSLYRTTAGGKEFIAVRGVGKRGGGDQLFKTVEEANAHIERQKIIDQQNEEVRKKREEREAAEAKKESDYVASFQGFKQDNPREFGRARKVLDVQRNYRDKVQTRKQIIEQSVADGANVIDGRLERPDGTSLGEDAVTKIGIQYAEHLIAARLRSDAAKAELRGDNEMSVALNRQADLLVKPESKWQAETRAKLDAVPALKGSKFDMDEKTGKVKVTRPDGLKATIHFNADEELAKAAIAKGKKPESIHGRAVRRSETEFDIYVRSDANHTNILNHEVMHWLEFNGVVTKEEVEKHGGREAIAEKYGKWAEVKLRKKDSVFQRIYDALEAVFSSQRKFFEEVGKRQSPQENLSKDKKPSVPQPTATVDDSTEDLLRKWIRSNKNGKYYIGTFANQHNLSQEQVDAIHIAMKTDPRFKQDKDTGYYPTAEAIADIAKTDSEALNKAAMKLLDDAKPGEAVRVYRKGNPDSGDRDLAVDPKFAAENFAEIRNQRLPQDYPSRFEPRKVNDDTWEVVLKDKPSEKPSVPPAETTQASADQVNVDSGAESKVKPEGTDDFDAEMEKLMTGLSKPESSSDSAAKPTKRTTKKHFDKPKKTAEEKSADDRALAAEKKAAAKQAMLDAFKGTQDKLTSGFDPEIGKKVAQATKLYIEAGALEFRAFIRDLVADFGKAWVEEKSQYFESAWRIANKLGWVDSPTGNVADYLNETEPNNSEQSDEETIGNNGNQGVEDGTRQPDGNESAIRDGSSGGGQAEGSPGESSDSVLPNTGSTKKGSKRRPSKGNGSGGRVNSGQSEQGQGDAADSGSTEGSEPVVNADAIDHVIQPDDDIAVSSVKESLERNVRALELLKELESAGRLPTDEERKALAQYTGWGGLSQAIDSIKGERMLSDHWQRDHNWEKQWGKYYVKLKSLLSKEELQAAQDSTENAHYTSKPVIQALWKIAERLGFDGGRVLELGAGVGHFVGLTPANIRASTKFVMVEMDSVSSRIAKQLYPSHEVFNVDMQKFRSVPGSVTMGIGNVPFAGGTVDDSISRYGQELNLHNYAFARHLDAIAPGGIVVAISSHSTLDNNIKQRQFLASKGDLIGAIRLPNNAFAENAKTQVVTDILIFRRPKQGEPKIGVRFDQNADVKVTTKDGREVVRSINKYFIDNPSMVLGSHSAKGSMYGADEYTVESTPGDLVSKLNTAIESLPLRLIGEIEVADQVVSSDTTIPFGRLEIRGDEIVMGHGDKFVPIAGQKFEGFPVHLTGKTGVSRARDYIELRDLLTDVRATMLDENASDDDVKRSQDKLSDSYDRYVQKHGPLNSNKTNIFSREPDYYRVLALENERSEYNAETKKIEVTYSKAAIFTDRVLGPQKEPQSASSPADAVSISIAWKGAINASFIGKLLGVTASEAETKLIEEGLAFRNPATTELELSDLYLSGNVRTKLAQAKLAVEEDSQYQKNVDALEKVLPEPVTIKKDTVRLGAAWIPPSVINAFASQAFGTDVIVSYNDNTDAWSLIRSGSVSQAAKAKYKTQRVDPEEILIETLNLRSIKVYDKIETGEYTDAGKPKTTQVLNEKETQAAKHRASVLRGEFEKWVMENAEVRQLLATLYNDKYNNFVRTKYNGDFLVLPGANPEVKLRPYQKNAIWRIINRGTSLLAHAVGSGKTYTMIGAAMEMRRLGLARRPLLVVQNATLGQFATSFQKMYPNANVLVADKDDLGKGNRQLFLNKISTGNWDAVVMAQSTFDNMASDPDVERAFIQDQLDLLEEAIREEGGEGAKTPTVKQLVRTKKSLKKRFDKLIASRSKKEDNVTFEDLGADALFLDEAHAYKKPIFMTKLSQLVGLNTSASARSLATTIKVRSIQGAHNGRNVVLATGTPVTNTLGEAWHMVNYVSPSTNADFSVRTFDQFIGNFAQVEPTLTMNAGGQYVYKDAIVKFRNGHQLVEYINDSWDIVTPDQLREYMESSSKGFPSLKGGQPTAVTVDRTPGVAAFMDFIDRVYKVFKALPAKERRFMSFIPALAYGASKAATLDIRLVNPNAAEEENSKLQNAADQIARIYEETSDTKGTQLFFSDMKNPFSMTRLRQFMGGESIDAFTEDDTPDNDPDSEDQSQPDDNESDSFLYVELKRKLLAKGIPAEQIAFVADAKTDKQRQALFERVNTGDIRVLIGSTAKMGVGVNVQNKLVALHHFDTPWLPADLEQREGRILRFGNENETVQIFRYAMKKTLDGAIYMATARKQKFIWQVLNGQLDGDSFEDPSSAAMLSIEEQLAAIQDNPLFFEKIAVQNRLRELELERQSFYDAQQRLSDSLHSTTYRLNDEENKLLPKLEARAERIQKLQDNGELQAFSMKHESETFTDPKKAAEYMKAKVSQVEAYITKNWNSARTFDRVDGGLLGMPAKQRIQFNIGPIQVVIAGQPALTTEMGDDGKVVTKPVTRFRSMAFLNEPGGIYQFYDGTATVPQTFFDKAQTILEETKKEINHSTQLIKKYREQITELKRLLDNKWEDQAEYDEKKARLEEIERLMLASGGTLSSDSADTKLAQTLTKLGQYVLPGMSESIDDINRQDFVRKHSSDALERFWQWSNKESDAPSIQDAIDSLSVPVNQLMTEIYQGKFNFLEDVHDSEIYGKIRVAASESDLEERILDSVDLAAMKALEAKPENDDTPDVLYQKVNPEVVVQATDLAIDAQDAGIKTFDELVAFSVKAIGEQRTKDIGNYLTMAANMLDIEGIRPVGDVIGMPGVTREQAKELAKAAFPMLSDEQINAGLDIQEATGFGREQVGYAPFGTPVPGGQNQRDDEGVKGWTQFISATRAIIGATSKADVSTFIHEFFHPMRKFLLDRNVPAESRSGITDEDIQALEDYAGVKDGKWTVNAEEKAAKAWEQYWFEGKSPTTGLRALFEKIAKWMASVYRGIDQITGGQLPDDVRSLFDKIIQRGGLKIEEFEMLPDDNLTSIKNEVMNELRVNRGLPELEDVAAQTQQEWIDAAASRMAADSTLADRLVKSIIADPRNLSDIEVAIFQLHYRQVNNSLESVSDDLFAAKDAGDAFESARLQKQTDRIMNALAEIEDASKAAGREWGRSGVARQIVLRKDFSLAGLMRRARIANGGNALSAKQQQEIIELSRQISELEAKLAKSDQEKLDLERQRNVDKSLHEEKKRTPARRTAAREKAVSAVSAFKQKFASVFGVSRSTDTLNQTEEERMAEEAMSVVKAYVKAGVFTFGEFMANVQRDIGGEMPVKAQVAFATAWQDAKLAGDIPTPAVDKKNLAGMTRLARQIQRSLVEAGITERDAVVNAVHQSLQEIEPEITRRETMDALSGYGQFSPLSKNEIDKIIRDLNGQLQQLAKLEDMQAGQAPSKTGGERRTPSDEERRLIKEVNEAKRRGGFTTTDPEAQLRSALEGAKTTARNRISDLKYEIENRQRIVRNKTELKPDAELEELKRQIEEWKVIHKGLFPKPGATLQQRLAATERSLDKAISEVEKQLSSGNVAPKKLLKTPLSSPSIDAKRAKLKALKDQRDAIRALANPKLTPEQRADRAYKASISKRISEYQERMVNNEFDPKPKKEVRKLTDEQLQLKKQLEDVKDEFFRKMAEYRLENMNVPQRIWDFVKESSHLSRAIMTSLDLSAVFRQGGAATFAHPKLAAETSREMLRAMLSGQANFDIAEDIRNDPMYQFAMTAKLSITEEEGNITRMEEAFMGRWVKYGIGREGSVANKVTKKLLSPVKMSSRAYSTFLNGIRFKLFKYMVESLGQNGQVTADEAKVIAQYVNVATGRADLGQANKAAANLNVLFFAPRFVASRFQYLAMPFYLLPSRKVSFRVKKAIVKEYARYATGIAAFLATAVGLGALAYDDDDEEKPTVELDPRSSDFMKIKMGETRIDPMSGFAQVVILISQVASGYKKDDTGKLRAIRGEEREWNSPTTWDVMARFVRTKFAPIPGAIVNVAVGENVVGDKVTPLSATGGLFAPLSLTEIKDTMVARGVPEGPAITILTLLGMGTSTYGDKTKYAKGTEEERSKQFSNDLKHMQWNSPDFAYSGMLTDEQRKQMEDRREHKKQDLVYAATYHPIRNKGQSEESFDKEVAERDKALESLKQTGWTKDEIKQLLRAYAKTRGNKEAVLNRIRSLNKLFKTQ